MTWKTDSVTFVECNDDLHVGDRMGKIETAFNISAGQALAKSGWTYNHKAGIHRCPPCTNRRGRLN